MLHKWTGEREFVERIAFPKRFELPPQVAVGLTLLDVDQGKNTRVAVEARNVDPEGFDLVFRTWSDTILYGTGANWVALEQAHGDTPAPRTSSSSPVVTRAGRGKIRHGRSTRGPANASSSSASRSRNASSRRRKWRSG